MMIARQSNARNNQKQFPIWHLIMHMDYLTWSRRGEDEQAKSLVPSIWGSSGLLWNGKEEHTDALLGMGRVAMCVDLQD